MVQIINKKFSAIQVKYNFCSFVLTCFIFQVCFYFILHYSHSVPNFSTSVYLLKDFQTKQTDGRVKNCRYF